MVRTPPKLWQSHRFPSNLPYVKLYPQLDTLTNTDNSYDIWAKEAQAYVTQLKSSHVKPSHGEESGFFHLFSTQRSIRARKSAQCETV